MMKQPQVPEMESGFASFYAPKDEKRRGAMPGVSGDPRALAAAIRQFRQSYGQTPGYDF